jgi:hypothetical protein
MADTKISGLPASTTPLAGTEELPIVQSGVTRKVSVANLTAGRAFSATQLTLTTGSVIVASGQGIDFSATPGTGTSELFNDYEEGTWTGAMVAGTSGTITLNASFRTGSYTKVGRLVTVTGLFYVDSVSSPVGSLSLTGLPYAINTGGAFARTAAAVSATGLAATATTAITGRGLAAESQIQLHKYVAGSIADLAGDVQADSQFYVSMSYITV